MKFTLRPWALKDLNDLVRHANDFEVAKNLTNKFPHPYTRKAGQEFIRFATKSDPIQIFAIEIDRQAVGGVGLHPQDDIYAKNAELGYWLSRAYWGKGIMTKVVSEMVDYGFRTFDINRIFARPFGSNLGSQRVLEKARFTLEARFAKTLYKNGAFEDELIYALRK